MNRMHPLCEAIRRRVLIEFRYDGLRRIVAPYCHGMSTSGRESLRGIQVQGETRSGGLGFGKLWTVSKMSDVRLTDMAFEPDDPHYNPNDSGMQQIHCRI
jgi:hypothetical protein